VQSHAGNEPGVFKTNTLRSRFLPQVVVPLARPCTEGAEGGWRRAGLPGRASNRAVTASSGSTAQPAASLGAWQLPPCLRRVVGGLSCLSALGSGGAGSDVAVEGSGCWLAGHEVAGAAQGGAEPGTLC